jgi:rfaE bifunctional protein nucleotidyltransferase chain/domain
MIDPPGGKIIFTNGCFDLMHWGHISLLEQAKAMGRLLVVAINDDEYIRRVKGEGRPIQSLEERAAAVMAIRHVDYLIPFGDNAGLERIISIVRPHVLVIGENWRDKKVVGREIVEAYGGRVDFVKLVPGYSTTELIRRIREGK